ncbi:PfkB family carbohydrate kinase [Mycolicibacterium vanbaalenii]|uniref:PfkB family carbohydrate kinase n=1 Tax=Mycolicibacterium vanbaalenii TaxID=110539 RepID=UPI0023BB1885|nr:PfkB family carbohydrate kinase [Mycolicibacterium vanbaalenii]
MATRLSVVGSANVDLTFSVTALPRPGETVLASALSSTPGGKGGNQAVAAARAGAQVQLVAALGTDAAAGQLKAHLKANAVGLDGVTAVPGPSGSAAILVDAAGENCIVVAGANGHLSLSSPAVREVVADSDVVLLSLEIPIDTAVTAARIGRSAGATVMLNASPASAQASALADLADVVVVNETESDGWLDGDRPRVPHLVITRGARGATYVGETRSEFPAPAVEAVDTTGAGDVFAGVLAANWPRGADYAVARACAAGALSTLVHGAGDCAPYSEAVEDVLEAS